MLLKNELTCETILQREFVRQYFSNLCYLHSYFNIHICRSLHVCHIDQVFPITLTTNGVLSQSVTIKNWLVCVKSEKCASIVILIPLGFMRQGKAKLSTLSY